MSSSKPMSEAQRKRQETRDHGRYAAYIPDDSDADELSGGFISRKVAGTSRTFWRDALATIDLSEETGGEVPKMDMLIDGKRTTQRTYSGAAGTLRMPSKAALERMADSGADTFDAPFQAGNDHGHVTGWARFHRDENGTWTVAPLVDDKRMSDYARRQMSWVLGAERPSFAMNQVASMNNLITEMDRMEGTEAHPVKGSSFIQEVGYDASTSTLYMSMHGNAYAYNDAPQALYDGLVRSQSMGRFYNAHIKQAGRKSVPADKCDSCGRYMPATEAHMCPSGNVATKDVDAARVKMSNAAWAVGVGTRGRGLARTMREFMEDSRAEQSHQEPQAPSTAPAPRPEWNEQARSFVVEHGLAPRPPRINIPGMDKVSIPSGTRFSSIRGQNAAELAKIVSSTRSAKGPNASTILAATSRDDSLSASGTIGSEGITITELRASSKNKDPQSAWADVVSRHPYLGDTEPPTVTRRSPRTGQWCLAWV